MGETVAEAFENTAGLLAHMGYVSFIIPQYSPPDPVGHLVPLQEPNSHGRRMTSRIPIA